MGTLYCPGHVKNVILLRAAILLTFVYTLLRTLIKFSDLTPHCISAFRNKKIYTHTRKPFYCRLLQVLHLKN